MILHKDYGDRFEVGTTEHGLPAFDIDDELAGAVHLLTQMDTTSEIELDAQEEETGYVRVKAHEWDAITIIRDEFLGLLAPHEAAEEEQGK